MPKYYCDYCDTFLTHDSASVRKSHIDGTRHQAAVRAYYAQLDSEYKDTPDRETMRYEKMKDDALQFMLMGPPMMPMGGYPPVMLPPPGYSGGYPPYGGGPPSNNGGQRYDSRGPPPKREDGWDERRSAPRADGRGPQASDNYNSGSQWNDRKAGYNDRRGGGSGGGNGYGSAGYGSGGGGGGFSSSAPSYAPEAAPSSSSSAPQGSYGGYAPQQPPSQSNSGPAPGQQPWR